LPFTFPSTLVVRNVKSMKAVAYYRVSTARQGQSGLGLEAQRQAVRAFLDGNGWPPVAEFTEVESGRNNARPELQKALAACKLYGATLVIAKLDRLSRNAAFLLTLRDSGVAFKAADMPEADSFTVGIFALLAQKEREIISQRTKAALAQSKARGVKLGGYRQGPTPDHMKATAARIEKADRFAAVVAPMIEQARAEGITSAKGIAGYLNDKGVPTKRGGRWQAVQVQRVLERL
jgi:DNA invertase Pin-like site-specific DNA recombinase